MEFSRLSFPLIDQFDEVVHRTAAQPWDGLALGDSPLIAGDVFSYSGYALALEPKLKIETAVTNLVLRDPGVLACAVATLWRLSGGRFDVGIGRGDSALHLLEIPPPKYPEFAESIVTFVAEMEKAGMEPAPMGPRIELSASGPRVAKLAARKTDGVIVAMGRDLEVLGPLVAELREEHQKSGERPTFRITVLLPIGIHTDRVAGHEIIRGSVATFANIAVRGRMPFLSAYFSEERAKELLAAYEYKGHSHAQAAHTQILAPEEIARYGIVGSVDECVDQVQAIADLGVDRVIVIGGSRDEYDVRTANEERVIREIAPRIN